MKNGHYVIEPLWGGATCTFHLHCKARNGLNGCVNKLFSLGVTAEALRMHINW